MAPQPVVRQWFVPGDGIAREVITADIQRYLGPDALVKPGRGTGEQQGVDGYWITAYRTLTSQMLQDLRLDSQRYAAEQQQSRGGRVAYEDSNTHYARQYHGPTPAPEAYGTDNRYPPPDRPPTGSYSTQPGYGAPYGYPQQPTYQTTTTTPHYVPTQGYAPQQATQPRTTYPAYGTTRDTDSPPAHYSHNAPQSYYATPGVPQQARDQPSQSPQQQSTPAYPQYSDPRYPNQQQGRRR